METCPSLGPQHSAASPEETGPSSKPAPRGSPRAGRGLSEEWVPPRARCPRLTQSVLGRGASSWWDGALRRPGMRSQPSPGTMRGTGKQCHLPASVPQLSQVQKVTNC